MKSSKPWILIGQRAASASGRWPRAVPGYIAPPITPREFPEFTRKNNRNLQSPREEISVKTNKKKQHLKPRRNIKSNIYKHLTTTVDILIFLFNLFFCLFVSDSGSHKNISIQWIDKKT